MKASADPRHQASLKFLIKGFTVFYPKSEQAKKMEIDG